MDKKNVLVFPGGTEIGLEIFRSLQFCKDVQLFSASSDVSNHAPYAFKEHLTIPRIDDPNWIYALNQIIDQYKIDYIFPAYDDIIIALGESSDKIKAQIITSPLKTCLVCRSKSKTYQLFKELLPTPKIFNNPSDIKAFPVFVKPDKGQGSQEASKVENVKALEVLLEKNPELLVLEYLPGKEFTIDCFTDRGRGLLFCNGRERIRTKSGISMNSKPVDDKRALLFQEMANIISRTLEFHGAWFFQLKIDDLGVYKLLEIAPRISGTMATNRVLGVNFPILSIYEAEGRSIEIMTNKYSVEIDRALINRYRHNIKYSHVYVDLDDTLIFNGEVNTSLIKFLYQAINQNCAITLITKTSANIDQVLEKYRLRQIFDSVISLTSKQSKADFINPKNAIFIDESFSERKSVFLKHKIPTFDCSMIEILLDERA